MVEHIRDILAKLYPEIDVYREGDPGQHASWAHWCVEWYEKGRRFGIDFYTKDAAEICATRLRALSRSVSVLRISDERELPDWYAEREERVNRTEYEADTGGMPGPV